MRYNWLRRITGFTVCTGLFAITGCYNMNGYVLNASGQSYYERGNYAQAAQEFQTALANNPRNPDYISNLAKARQKMGDQATAEQLFRQALTIAPSHQPSYHGMAEMMLNQGRGQEAEQLVATWAGTQPYIAESHVEMAWVQREMGQHEAAAQTLQTALKVNPNHSTALAHLGQYYQDSGQTNQAIAMYQQSLRSNFDQPEVQSRLAVAAAAAGPNHPMGEIAMARGVHPHTIPQSQMAFGNPGQPPFSQPQLAQTPMMAAPQLAYQPQPYQQQIAYQQSHGVQQPYGPPPTGQQQAFSPPMPIGFGMAGGEIITSPASNPQSGPVPDPAFVESVPSTTTSVPVTSVSQSSPVPDDGMPPAIEAF
jgi:tetratricopeptide (TPR) repeat protein